MGCRAARNQSRVPAHAGHIAVAGSPRNAVARAGDADEAAVAVVDVPATATDSAGTPAIQFSGVSKRYGSQVALHPIDLEIRDGEFFCLLGPSGCGKSTTLSLIGGFAAPSSGEIRISGELVNQTPPHRRKVNTVFQSYALFPHMNVSDNVAFGLKMAKVPRRECESRVAEALGLVALELYEDRYPGQLS